MMVSSSRQFPIKVALIGLSASAVTSWAATGHLPYLLSAAGRESYSIIALCNSSKDAAQQAIQHYNLPATTRAYGNPQDLANDSDVQMIICNTRVDKHLETIMPSIRAGKDIYVEWPIASKKAEVQQILQAAEERNSTVAVGVQGRWAPPILKVREILTNRNVGKVLSSDVQIFGGSTKGRDILTPGFEYFADKSIGGNHATILFGHLIDQVQFLLAPLAENTTKAHTQVRWPKVNVLDPSKNKVIDVVNADAPDLLYVTGQFQSSPFIASSATFFASYHRTWPFPGEPTITLNITCEHADIRLRVYDFPALQADAYGKPILIEIRKVDLDEVEHVEWQWPQEVRDLPTRARNTAVCLSAFARGEKGQWAGLADAAIVAEQLESWINGKAW